jgi:hypothetical protein
LVTKGETGALWQPLKKLVLAIDKRKKYEILLQFFIRVLYDIDCANVAEYVLFAKGLKIVALLPRFKSGVIVEFEGACPCDEKLFGFLLLFAGLDW